MAEETTTTGTPSEPTVNLSLGVTEDTLIALGEATPEDEIHYREAKTRSGQSVMRDGAPLMLAYVNARFVQDRLDSTVGPGVWQSHFVDLQSGAVRCGIGILVSRGTHDEWVWKWDVGIPSNIEPEKGAHSDAFKRAGVQWGIARDLYEERDADPEVPLNTKQETTATPAGVRAQVYPGSTQTPPADATDDSTWVCPIHNEVKEVAAGVSQRTGKKYTAFRACPVPGCDEKEPFKRR